MALLINGKSDGRLWRKPKLKIGKQSSAALSQEGE